MDYYNEISKDREEFEKKFPSVDPEKSKII
jgi:hypothetical protein